MKRLRESKGLRLALSLAIAIGLWLYVRVAVDPVGSTTLNNLSVVLTGEETLEARGLMVSDVSPQGISITFNGAASTRQRIARERPTLVVDLSRITKAGTHTLNYTINYPTTVSASSLTTSRDTSSVTVTVAALASKQLPIEGVFLGSVAEGYQAGTLTISPQTVTVSGEEENVDKVARAVVEVGGEDLLETYTGELPVILQDADGNRIADGMVRSDISRAVVTMPVVVVREIPLTVDLLYNGGVPRDGNHVQVSISPASISVTGEEQDLEGLTEISLGEIDLADIYTTQISSYDIVLPQELTNASGITHATVSVLITGLDQMTMTVDQGQIGLTNITEGYQATLVTQSLEIQLRGPAGSLDGITPDQIRVVGDLGDIVTATGRYPVPARVTIVGHSEVGAVGEYEVIVQVSR